MQCNFWPYLWDLLCYQLDTVNIQATKQQKLMLDVYVSPTLFSSGQARHRLDGDSVNEKNINESFPFWVSNLIFTILSS